MLDQVGKSIKSYIKMFEAAGLLGPLPCPGRVKKKTPTQVFSCEYC